VLIIGPFQAISSPDPTDRAVPGLDRAQALTPTVG
jgi:hypothetical protein